MKFKKFKTSSILKIIDKYQLSKDFVYNTAKNRKILFDELNQTFFPDNIAKFVDHSNDYASHLSIMIEYKGDQYNILAYKLDVRNKVDRLRKLKKLKNEY